jgi:hypothetical protein
MQIAVRRDKTETYNPRRLKAEAAWRTTNDGFNT